MSTILPLATTFERPLRLAVDPEVADVIRELAAHGHRAVVVGGAVRDTLRRVDAKDWDVATSARPDEVMAVFPAADGRSSRFGTVFVPAPSGAIEVTTFRRDGAYPDGRRPETVELSDDLVEDLARRDLTINAMAYDPVASVLIDPFGGLYDLRNATLRAVGDPRARLEEDPLRAVRLARFVGSTGFRIEPSTRAAVRGMGERIAATVSPERLGSELMRIAASPRPRLALRVIAEADLVPAFLPGTHPAASTRLGTLLNRLDRAIGGADGWLALVACAAMRDEPLWRSLADRLALGDATIEAVAGRLRIATLLLDGLDRPRLIALLPSGRAVDDGLVLRRALWRAGLAPNDGGRLARRITLIGTQRLPRDLAGLALSGGELAALGFRGPDIGGAHRRLWYEVALGSLPNRRGPLEGRAKQWLGSEIPPAPDYLRRH